MVPIAHMVGDSCVLKQKLEKISMNKYYNVSYQVHSW